MAHIVSNTQPPDGALGDEWFNPTSNKIYKLVAYDGVSVAWQEQMTANSSVVITNNAQTLTNKRIDPRVTSAVTATSLTPDVSTTDIYAYTALASALTINAPIGTPANGDKLMFRFLDNGNAQTLTWNATYTVIGVTLPTTTTANKTTYVGCIYNTNNARWDVIAVTTQA